MDTSKAHHLVAALGLDLTAEQQAVVLGAPDGPAVVIAGAGSGKTAVMAARIAVLIAADAVAPHEVLGLTFTRKAAAELAERVDSYLRKGRRSGLLGPRAADPDISTYHSFAQRFVREHGVWLGIDPDLRVESEFALLPLAYEVVLRSAVLARRTDHDFSPAKAVAAMRTLDAELAEHVVATADLRAHEKARLAELGAIKSSADTRKLVAACTDRILVSELVDEFRSAKSLAGVMDYADMMRLAQQIAAVGGEPVARTRQGYRTVLLDEYQDTSVVQRMLLQRLFGQGHQVLAVGDPKQSIYAFRGAAAGSIEAFGEHFPQRSGALAPTFSLSVNFRSGPAIVAVANSSAASRRAGQDSDAAVTLTSGRPGLTDVVEVHTFRSNADERRFVVDAVATELAEGRSGDDIIVLARSNDSVTEFAGALQRAGIPAVSSDQAGLFEMPHILDVLAQLAVVVDPGANAELVRLLAGPRWRIGLRDLNLLGERARELAGEPWRPSDSAGLTGRLQQAAGAGSDPVELPCLADALADPGPGAFSDAARARFGALHRELEMLARHVGEPVPDLIARILRITGIDTEALLSPDAARLVAAIDSLLSVASSFPVGSPGAQAAGFLRLVRLASDSDADPGFDAPAPAGSVRVMTVHKAKGLQAEVVFLPDVSARAYDTVRLLDHWTTTPGALPDDLRGDLTPSAHLLVPLTTREVAELRHVASQASVAELERLIYVALTRARARLVVSGHHWRPGLRNRRAPSRHLEDLKSHPDVQVGHWYEPPAVETSNPLADTGAELEEIDFPHVDPDRVGRIEAHAKLVQSLLAAAPETHPTPDPSTAPDTPVASEPATADVDATVARWDADIAALGRELEERRAGVIDVDLPAGLSTSAMQRLFEDPTGFAVDLRRPMPRRPSRAARRGTRFHDWVATRWDQRPLVDVAEFAADRDLDRLEQSELDDLIAAFEIGEYADRTPTHVEYPFTVTIAGMAVSGRIDAVYALDDPPAGSTSDKRWEVVDWKTSRRAVADPMQLALYRLAWAKLAGVAPAQVTAAFYYVPTGRRVVAQDLPEEAALADLLASRLAATAATNPLAADRQTSPQ